MDIVTYVSVADALAAMAVEGIASARTAGEVARAMALLSEALEREVAGTREGGSSVACGPGCAGCCIVNVSVLVPEAIAVFCFLHGSTATDERVLLADRLVAFADRVRWMDDTERPRHRLGCPFLDPRGSCIIHPVRPLLCRSISSVDPASCRDALAMGTATVIMDLPQKILCSLIFSGIGSALQGRGLDSRSLELTRMVSALLRDSNLVDDFLAGRRVPFL